MSRTRAPTRHFKGKGERKGSRPLYIRARRGGLLRGHRALRPLATCPGVRPVATPAHQPCRSTRVLLVPVAKKMTYTKVHLTPFAKTPFARITREARQDMVGRTPSAPGMG